MKELFGGLLKRPDAKWLAPCFAVIAIGAAFMIIAGNIRSGSDTPVIGAMDIITAGTDGGQEGEATPAGTAASRKYEEELEKKISSVLSKVQGAGRVHVALTVAESDEIELAEDIIYETAAEPSSESSKSAVTEKRESRHIFVTGKDGRTEPVVIKRVEPSVTGAVIVADGGGDAEIKAALTRAAAALLNLPTHKIEVLKMSGR